ncbi:hypothetical protein BDW72DRAFT_163696 [Aspergillus terricola var. indicus]
MFRAAFNGSVFELGLYGDGSREKVGAAGVEVSARKARERHCCWEVFLEHLT